MLRGGPTYAERLDRREGALSGRGGRGRITGAPVESRAVANHPSAASKSSSSTDSAKARAIRSRVLSLRKRIPTAIGRSDLRLEPCKPPVSLKCTSALADTQPERGTRLASMSDAAHVA